MVIDLLQFVSNTFTDFLFFFGYIQNTNSFPQPLSPEEEQEYITLYKNGSDDAKNVLIERNLRLVAHIVKKYTNENRDTDDLISIGTIGLIKAIITFDHTKNIKLATYAARCIENEILMHIRYSKKQKIEISIDDAIGEDQEGNEVCLLDIMGSDINAIVDEIGDNEQVQKLYNEIGKVLSPREKIIIENRYGLNNKASKPQRAIAKDLDISRSYVSRIEKRALEKLYRVMKDTI